MKRLLTRARLATLAPDRPGLGLVEDGAILIEDGRIAFAGAAQDLPAHSAAGAETRDLEGRWVTPAPIDCHTHLIHGGDRAREFEMRLAGATYEEIARAGGGIVASIAATRALSVEALVASALPRLDALLAEGTTTVEIKSGYGLAIEAELRMLAAARRLSELRPIRIATTWLAAHATPPEYSGRNGAYLGEVVIPGLHLAAERGLVDAVDGFCEGIAFSADEIERVFAAARALGLPVKLHAEQLSHAGGAALAARFGALSADHLEYCDAADARLMAEAGTVAVLLPGAYYFLRETQVPPVDLLRAAGTRMALATDCNPGTSPLTSLLLTMNMGATLFRMTVAECLAGVTREAARALGLLGETGTLESGKSADLAVWDIGQPAELVYRIGFNPLHARFFRGEETSA
ncbi:MAG: imidazolonepropionase [Methylorubrum populi]